MGMLFEKGPLQQDTGLLNERWGQDGSKIVNISTTLGNVGATVYTVTTNKKLFVKSIIIITTSADGDSFTLKDGSAGTNRLSYELPTTIGIANTVVFDTPIIFEDAIYYNPSGGPNININITGWEE